MAQDYIARYDLAGRIRYLSDDLVVLLGLSGLDFVGKCPGELGVGERYTALEEAAARMIQAAAVQVGASGAPRHLELQVPTPTGSVAYHQTLMVPERDAAGAIIGVLMVGHDLTGMRETEQRLSHLINSIPGIVYTFRRDADGAVSFPYISQTVREIYGFEPEVVNKDCSLIHELAHPDDRPAIEAALEASARTMTPFRIESRVCRPGWPERWLDVRSVPERQLDGSILWYGVMLDITDRKLAEQALRKRERELHNLAENSPDNIIRYDSHGRIRYLNANLARYLDTSLAEVEGLSIPEAWPNGQFDEIEAAMWRAIREGEINTFILHLPGDGAGIRHHQIRIVPERDESNRIVGALTFGTDVTEIVRLQEAIAAREQEFRALVEHSPDTITRFDRDCRRIYVNPTLLDSYGERANELLGKRPTEFPGGRWAQDYEETLRRVLTHGETVDFELSGRETGRRIVHRLIRLTPERDLCGNIISVLAIGRDITELTEQREKIHNLAFFDFVTSLPNRALFHDRLNRSITDARRRGTQFSVLLLDLDRFKAINDAFGHDVGDQLLREAAVRLSRSVRSYDTVARLGGDEFGLILPEIRTHHGPGSVASKILAEFAAPFMIDGREMFSGASIGIAVFPTDSDEAASLLKFADLAMYAAKNAGGQNFQYYTTEFTAQAHERVRIETELRHAVERNELELYFQPKVAMSSGALVGSEALLRWNSPCFGLVMPDRFIGIAEDTGLIVDIGAWVLREACHVACAWNTESTSHTVAVNLSPRQFTDGSLDERIAATLRETGCRPEWIELEITESLLINKTDKVRRTLEALRTMGLSIAIDDFGTGYSALSYLTDLPINVLKIDRSFVKDMLQDSSKTELVKIITAMANSLGMGLVAEGVESEQQAAFLLTSGCFVGQGYLYGKPMIRHDLINAWRLPELPWHPVAAQTGHEVLEKRSC